MEITEFLKKNKDKYFDAYEISQATESSFRSVCKALERLRDTNLVEFRETESDKTSHTKTIYRYKDIDLALEKILKELRDVSRMEGIRGNFNRTDMLLLMNIKEVIKLREGK